MDHSGSRQTWSKSTRLYDLGIDRIYQPPHEGLNKLPQCHSFDRRILRSDSQNPFTAEEKEFKSKRKRVQEKLIKFATRIPAFMYLTDFRENTLQDVITKLEPELFRVVTGLTVEDFHMLVRLRVFNTEQMNQAVFAFRRYEDASLRYTGIESHEALTHYGLYDTVVAKE